MGSVTSGRWPKNYHRKMQVETCRRITARECCHVQISTVQTVVGNSKARRSYCVCPGCNSRTRFLYERPDRARVFRCRRCQRLSYARQQLKGSREGFEKWLTAARWNRISLKHPATTRLYEQMHALYLEQVAPFDLDKMTDVRRTELLETYASEAVIRHVFDQQRAAWSAQIEPMVEAAGVQIRADIWEMWKRRNRPQKKS